MNKIERIRLKFIGLLKKARRSLPFNKIENINRTSLLALEVNSQLREFKNIYKGRDIYIVGCGPTEKYFELPKDDSIFIGINRAFKDDRIKFDYLFAQDVFNEDWEEFAKYRNGYCKKMLAWITSNDDILIRNSDANKIRDPYRYVLDCYQMKKFPYDISYQPFADLRGTVFSAIQFALYTNPRRVFLVGFDCSSGDVFKNNNENFKYQFKSWKIVKEYVNYFWNTVEFISINPVGLKNLFRDVYTTSFLEHYEKDSK